VGKLKTKDAFSLQKNTFKKQDKFDLFEINRRGEKNSLQSLVA